MLLNAGIATRLIGDVQVDAAWKAEGVTDQFLENADTYHARYFHNDYWSYVISRALALAELDKDREMRVLDIGSGSGNTVFASLELLPNATIVATDISPQLLQILENVAKAGGHGERIETYCFDLHKNFFQDGMFDVAIGGAILHHMLDPVEALRNVSRWLRSGSRMVLIEPMEVGGHVMTAIFLTVLGEVDLSDHTRLRTFFEAMCQDYEARFGVPRVKPWTSDLDDKWLFHTAYLQQMASALGLRLVMTAPIGTTFDHMFRDHLRGTLNVAGLADLHVPPAVWRVLDRFDEGITSDLKRELIADGILIFEKT